jgi:hypothetical protein
MKNPLQLAGFVVALLLAIAAGVYAWRMIGDAEISLIGWLSIGFGVIATLGLGGGLMALVFYSARHGYDDIDRGGRRR